jgi:hypothetical protein
MNGDMMWINHLELLPGDSTVITSFNAIDSGVGGGLSGLIIQSTTVGENGPPPHHGIKVVQTALAIPPGQLINGVRVCYELTNGRSFISQIILAQVQDPPSTANVLLDDLTDLNNTGPVCVNSQSISIDPTAGSVILALRVNFGDTSDKIVIRGLGVLLQSKLS